MISAEQWTGSQVIAPLNRGRVSIHREAQKDTRIKAPEREINNWREQDVTGVSGKLYVNSYELFYSPFPLYNIQRWKATKFTLDEVERESGCSF